MRKTAIIFLGVIMVSSLLAAGCKKAKKEEPKPAPQVGATVTAPQAGAAVAPLADTGPGSSGCADLRGSYQVTQLATFLGCSRDGKQLEIPDWKNALPQKSELAIIQSGCTVEATENISSPKTKISLAGKSSKEGELTLNVKNPADLSLPLKMTVNNKHQTCTYKGGLNWTGKLESKGLLKGNVKYSLTLSGTGSACPQSCGIVTEFDATGK